MKILFHTRASSELAWASQTIELTRLPVAGEYVTVRDSDGEQRSHHQIRLVVHVADDSKLDAEIFCNQVGPTQMKRLGWSSTMPTDSVGPPTMVLPPTIMMMTIEQAAKATGLSDDTIRRRIKDGRLQAENYGTAKRPSWRIAPAKLAALKPIEQSPQEQPALMPTRRGGRRRKLPTTAEEWMTYY